MALRTTISQMLETAPVVYEADLVDTAHPVNVTLLSDPNALRLPDLESLRGALEAARHLLGFLDVDVLVEHEGQHGSAWEEVTQGSMQYFYSLRFFRVLAPSGMISLIVNPSHVGWGETDRLSSLQKASVAAHPIEPSPADRAQIITYGYRDVEEVAERAIDNNGRGLAHMPVPLSYRRSTDRRVFDLGQAPCLKPRLEDIINSTLDPYSLPTVLEPQAIIDFLA